MGQGVGRLSSQQLHEGPPTGRRGLQLVSHFPLQRFPLPPCLATHVPLLLGFLFRFLLLKAVFQSFCAMIFYPRVVLVLDQPLA